ncbi:MAG: transketolase [Candidatus Omnitrophica bacterium]|nr:transketolase [Candidatus Omnitrophota bacterium]
MMSKDLHNLSTPLDARSKLLRQKIVNVFKYSRRGHVGAAFSLVEILRVLYDEILHFDPKNPHWNKRDRCILSKGHGCLALYALLAEKGFFDPKEMERFCLFDGILGGHPEHRVPGVEASTGSLGHGLSLGLGMALGCRYDKSPGRTFVIVGDGECNEGSIWEAAMCAGKHKLEQLTVIVDYNKHQSYSTTLEVQDMEPFADKWSAFGFAAREVDGHDVVALKEVLNKVPLEPGKPTAIIAHTIKGKGVSFVENNLKWHHKNKVTDEEIRSLLKELEV